MPCAAGRGRRSSPLALQPAAGAASLMPPCLLSLAGRTMALAVPAPSWRQLWLEAQIWRMQATMAATAPQPMAAHTTVRNGSRFPAGQRQMPFGRHVLRSALRSCAEVLLPLPCSCITGGSYYEARWGGMWGVQCAGIRLNCATQRCNSLAQPALLRPQCTSAVLPQCSTAAPTCLPSRCLPCRNRTALLQLPRQPLRRQPGGRLICRFTRRLVPWRHG